MSKRFTYEEESTVITFTDHVSAFNGLKRADIKDKGALSNKISAYLFEYLNDKEVPTQYIEIIDEVSQRVKIVDMVPIEIIIRNKAAGPWMESLGFNHGEALNKPVIEYRLKKPGLKDPLINSTHIYALDLCSETELAYIHDLSILINTLLTNLFMDLKIYLIDLKLEFGKDQQGQLVLADSITPDTMRIWDKGTLDPLDKDVFRKDLGKLNDSYRVVLKRLENHV